MTKVSVEREVVNFGGLFFFSAVMFFVIKVLVA